MINIILIAVILILAAYIYYKEIKNMHAKMILYNITIKFIGGNKAKLTLNEEQYNQFKAWVDQAEGVYKAGDDTKSITLNRKHVASVEVRKR